MASKREAIPPAYRVYIDTTDLFTQDTVGFSDSGGINLGGGVDFVDQIMTSVPEDGVNMTTSSDFGAPLNEGGGLINTASQLGSELTGFTFDFTNQVLFFKKQVWNGSEAMSVDIDMEFVTIESPFDDVVRPAITMLSIPLPENKGEQGEERWTLGAPVLEGERDLSVKISKMNFPSVLPTNVDVSWSRTYCKEPGTFNEAYPVKADVSFSFIASELPTRSNIGFDIEGFGPSGTEVFIPEGATASDVFGGF